LLVDTEGMVLKVKVHSAKVPDQDGLRVLLESARSRFSRLSHLWVDEIDRAGSLWRENGLVFATKIGTPLNRHNLTQRSFRPLLAKAGLPQIRFHDLRHTCATILLSKGVHAKFVQAALGHSTIAITLDTYSHVLPGMGSGTADAMDEALR
jgi:integrase